MVIPALCVGVSVLVVSCVPRPGFKLCGWATPGREGEILLEGIFGGLSYFLALVVPFISESTVER